MSDRIEESVLVIATRPSDRRLVDELLVAAGASSHEAISDPVRRVVSSPVEESATEVSDRPHATIVCHRATTGAPRPTLPAVDGAGRLVVLSDCTAEQAVVEALEAGAHYYFDIAEPRPVLQARLSAALRSHARQFRRDLIVPPFRFELVERRAWCEGRLVDLSPKEFDLAFYLFSNRERAVGNRELMTAVWSLPRGMDGRRIDTAAYRVRKKLGLEGADGWRLKRLRRKGYRLIGPGEGL